MVALLDLIDHVHPFDYAAENRVVAIQPRLRLKADVELAARRLAVRIYLVAGPRGSDGPAQMMLILVDLGGHGVARTSHPRPIRIAALHHEVRHDAMKRQAVVESLLDQGLEVIDRLGSDLRIKLDHKGAAFGLDDCVVAGVSHG